MAECINSRRSPASNRRAKSSAASDAAALQGGALGLRGERLLAVPRPIPGSRRGQMLQQRRRRRRAKGPRVAEEGGNPSDLVEEL